MLKIKKIELIVLGTLLQSFSFLSIKFASIYEKYFFIFLVGAFVFIILRAYIWQIVLKYNELSRVYPFNSLVQIFIFVYAVYIFNEEVLINNIIGLGLMILGLLYLAKDKK